MRSRNKDSAMKKREILKAREWSAGLITQEK